MRYLGSKRRIAKHILPIILKNRKEDQYYVEPFVGGGNSIEKVDGKRIGADANKYLIAMWQELQKGWIPPDFVSAEEHKDVKLHMEEKYPPHHIAFVRFGSSFGGDWNGGYARNVRKNLPNADYINQYVKSITKQSKNALMKALPAIMDVEFVHSSYDDLTIPDKSIIYCDPPYEGTTKYNDGMDHEKFWQWCRNQKESGHEIFISEYKAPEDFKMVWEMESTNGTGKRRKAIEKLFTL